MSITGRRVNMGEKRGELISPLIELLSKYDKTTNDIAKEEIETLLASLVHDRKKCESPIEFMITRTLNKFLETFNARCRKNFIIENQATIKAKNKTYRADLLIKRAHGEGPEIIIECDGHNFHEKTKEQAQKDKERDRNLQLEGYQVIRFTGSEIFNSPAKCAAEAVEHLSKQIK
jgi:very-short-patch-repair endonuclease